MHWAFNFLVAFLAGFFAGFTYRTYKLKHQLMDKAEFDELLTEYGFVKKPFAVHWLVEILLKIAIVAYVSLMVYFSVFEGIGKMIELLSIGIVQIGTLILFGFVTGYLYKSYRIKYILISPEKIMELYEDYGVIHKPEVHHTIDKIIKIIIIALISAMIYFSIYP